MNFDLLNKWWIANMQIYTKELLEYIDKRIEATLDKKLNGDNI